MKTLLTSFYSFLKKNKLPTKEQIIELRDQPMSPHKWVFIISCMLVVGLFLSILMTISNRFSVEIPDYGGSTSEGVIGAPHFINPILATSETDQALTKMVYSGLVKEDDNKNLVPILAESFIVSPDGKEYRFTLKNKLVFSNNRALTSSDVLFTFETKKHISTLNDTQNSWSLISIEAPDSKTFVIRTSGSPDDLFKKLSLEIIPKALWSGVNIESIQDSTLNTKPIGSGPFIIKKINYNNTIPKEILLKRNPYFAGAKPYLKTIKINIFANQLDLKAALLNNVVNGTSMLGNQYIDTKIKNNFSVKQVMTEKNISIFSNQVGQTSHAAVALSIISPVIDRNKIVDMIENGYGIPINSSGKDSSTDSVEIVSRLEKQGYKKNELGILIKSNSPVVVSIVVKKDEQLLKVAEQFSKELSNFGILTELKVFDQGLFIDQIQQGTYPFVLGIDSEISPSYKNILPLYTKIIPHIKSNNLHESSPEIIKNSDEIFRDIEKWYVRTDRIWKWFK